MPTDIFDITPYVGNNRFNGEALNNKAQTLIELRGDMSDDSYGEALSEVQRSEQPNAVLANQAGVVGQQLTETATAGLTEGVMAQPQVAQAAVEAQHGINLLSTTYNTEHGITAAYAEMYAGEGLDAYQVRQADSRMYAHQKMYDYMQSKTTGEKLVDFGKAFLFDTDYKDLTDLSKAITGSRLNYGELAIKYRSLDPDLQKQALDSLFPQIVESFDDNMLGVGFAIALLTEDDMVKELRFAQSMGALDASMLGMLISKWVKPAKMMKTASKMGTMLKNTKSATEVAARSNTPEKMANVIGDGEDLVDNMSMLNKSELAPGRIDLTEELMANLNKKAEDADIQRMLAEEIKPEIDLLKSEVSAPNVQKLNNNISDMLERVKGEMAAKGHIITSAEVKDGKLAVGYSQMSPLTDLGDLTKKEALKMMEAEVIRRQAKIFGLGLEDVGKLDGFKMFDGELLVTDAGLAVSNLKRVFRETTDATTAESFILDMTSNLTNARNAVRKGTVPDGLEDTFAKVFDGYGKAGEYKKVTVEYPISKADEDILDMTAPDGSWLANNPVSSFLMDPQTTLGGADDWISKVVKDTSFAGNQSATATKILGDTYKGAVKGINRKGMGKINSVLLAGDEFVDANKAGKVYSLHELTVKGIETVNGTMTLTRKEAESYFKLRQYMDGLYDLNNTMLREGLVTLGYKEIGVLEDSGKVVKTVAREVDGHWVTLQGGKRLGAVTDIERFTDVKDLPAKVLNYSEGQIPRIFKPGMGYVDDLDGNTVRIFKSPQQAKKWAKEQNARGGKQFVGREDKNLTPEAQLENSLKSSGGLYTGARSSKRIVVGEEGVSYTEGGVRYNAFESIDRYTNHMAKAMPINTYRMQTLDRFKKWINKMAQTEGKASGFADPTDWGSAITIENRLVRARAEELQYYLKNTLFSASTEERAWTKMWLAVAQSVDKSDSKLIQAMYSPSVWLSSKDPVKAIKASVFNTLLGVFGPRQYLVQGQNASLIMARFPKEAPQALLNYPQLRMISLMNSREARKGAIKQMGKQNKWNTAYMKDLEESAEQFRKSGLLNSIMNNADYGGVGAGVSQPVWSKINWVSDKGRFFYKEGELASRLTTWTIVRKRWIKSNPGKEIDSDAIRDMHDMVLKYHMNMQQENAAKWQKGILGIPTQFQQVQAKFTTNLVMGAVFNKGEWTRGEALAILGGQLAFYGVVGVPLAEQLASMMADASGTSIDEIIRSDNFTGRAMTDGMWGAMFEALGVNVSTQSSFSLASSMDETTLVQLADVIVSTFNSADRTSVDASKLFAGPSGALLSRTGDSVLQFSTAMAALFADPGIETTTNAALQGADAIASLTSTWTNAEKASLLKEEGKVFKTTGRLLASGLEGHEDLNPQTRFARAMGFPTNIEISLIEGARDKVDYDKFMQKRQTMMQQALAKYAGNPIQLHTATRFALRGLNPIERDKLLKNVMEAAIKNPVDKTIIDIMTAMIESGGKVKAHRLQGEEIL